MSAQLRLRRRIGILEKRQAIRVDMVEQRKNDLDAIVEAKQREIDNLRTQLTITISPKGDVEIGVSA